MITLEFWIDGHIHALRHTTHVPDIGDKVRFLDITYKLFSKIFLYDDGPIESVRVAFNMEEVPRPLETER